MNKIKDRDNIVKEIIGIVKEFVDGDCDINENSVLSSNIGENTLNMSSITFVEMIVAIEDKYGIAIELDSRMDTVSDIVDYVISEYMNSDSQDN